MCVCVCACVLFFKCVAAWSVSWTQVLTKQRKHAPVSSMYAGFSAGRLGCVHPRANGFRCLGNHERARNPHVFRKTCALVFFLDGGIPVFSISDANAHRMSQWPLFGILQVQVWTAIVVCRQRQFVGDLAVGKAGQSPMGAVVTA